MQFLLTAQSDLLNGKGTTSSKIEVIHTRCLILRVLRIVVFKIIRGRVATNGYALRVVGNLGSTRTLLVIILELVSEWPLVVRILCRSLAIEVIEEDNLCVSLLTRLLDIDRTLEEDRRNDNLGLTGSAGIAAYRNGQSVVALALFGSYNCPIGVARNGCPSAIATHGEGLAALDCIELQCERFESLTCDLLGNLQLGNYRINIFGVTPCKRQCEEHHRQSKKQMLQMFHRC